MGFYKCLWTVTSVVFKLEQQQRPAENQERGLDLQHFIPASPRAANGRRPLAAPASVASVGAALCLKIHFFFEGCYIEAAQNFIEGVHFLPEIGDKKLPSLNWF